MPFGKAAQMIEEILAVQTNEETVRQLTERIGACMEAVQTAEAGADGSHESHDQPPLQRCVFSADGAMISLVHTQWAETRTVAVGELEEQLVTENKQEIHVGHLSYFSRLADASTFTTLAEVEMQRRKVGEAREVCAVMDGADWLQTFADRHRPDAVRILDFPHAAEHVTQLLEALEKVGMHFPPQMLDRCLHILKHRGPRPLLLIADRLGSDLVQQKGVQEHLDYLRKREALMQYPAFRQQGWPIGSGMVESANKNVVEARLKGPGMHWERGNVNPMLALRTAVCNDRWREMWQKALQHHRKLQALHRSARAKPPAHAFLAGRDASSQESPPSASATVSEHISPARAFVSRRQRLLLYRKLRSPVSVVFPVGANSRPHGSGGTVPSTNHLKYTQTCVCAECLWRGSKAIGPNSIVLIGVANEPIGSSLRGSPPVFLLPKGSTKKLVVSRDTSRCSVHLNHS